MVPASDPLARVKRAAASKRRAEQEYRAALVESVRELQAAGARDAYARVAEAAGVSRQAVREMVTKAAPAAVDAVALEAELAALDARWDAFIDALHGRFMPAEDERAQEQRYRNQENGRAKRQAAGVTRTGKPSGSCGRKSRVRPTVTVEARRRAETYALRFLEENASHPVCVGVLLELDRAASLREQLEAIQNARVPFLHD